MVDTRYLSSFLAKPSGIAGPSLGSARRSFSGAGEPSMADVMSDSIVRQIMARDGVGADQLTSLIENVRSHLE